MSALHWVVFLLVMGMVMRRSTWVLMSYGIAKVFVVEMQEVNAPARMRLSLSGADGSWLRVRAA